MAEQYTNIRVILDKILRHPLMQDLNLETTIDYTIDFMRIVGNPTIFTEKTEFLGVEKWRTALPCDFNRAIQLKMSDSNAVFRYSTDNFHMSDCKTDYGSFTYKIQGNVLYTSIEEGIVELSYEAIAVDDEGYPLLPDNSSFTRALELYIKKQWFTILFDLGKITSPVFSNVKQEYAWAVGDCQSEFNRLSIDKAESFFNSWKTLILRDNEHTTGFRHNGTKEKLKVQ